jgi:hypothetical protein
MEIKCKFTSMKLLVNIINDQYFVILEMQNFLFYILTPVNLLLSALAFNVLAPTVSLNTCLMI